MAVMSTTTKGRIGLKLAGQGARHPKAVLLGGRATKRAAGPLARLGLTVGAPIARRRARRRARDLGHTAQSVAHGAQSVAETALAVGEALVTRGPLAAQRLGLAEAPKPKRTAPRVVAGAALGASAVYFLEPGGPGKEHRQRALELVS